MHQFRQAYELDRTELGQFAESPRGAGAAPAGAGARPGRARRGAGALRDLGQRRRAAARSTGLEAEVLPHPPQALAYRCEASQAIRPLRQPARPREADRPAARGGGAAARLRRRDRRRRARPRAARGARPRARPQRPGPRSRAASTPTRLADLYARCPAVFYAPVDEDFGMVPFEAFLSGKPVITTTDAGGPLDVVHDRRDRARRRAGGAEVARAGRAGCASTRPRRRRSGARGRRSPTRSPGTVHREAARGVASGTRGVVRAVGGGRPMPAAGVGWRTDMKVAYFSPAAAGRVGDRRLLGAAPARAASGTSRSRSVERGATAAPRGHRPRRSTTSATTPTRTGGSSTRSGARRASSSCTTSSSTTSSRASRSAAATATATWTRWSAEAGVVGRLLGYGVLDRRLPPLWESRPEDFPLAGEVLDLATGVIVHSRYVEERVRGGGLRGAGRPRIRTRPGRSAMSSRRPSRATR